MTIVTREEEGGERVSYRPSEEAGQTNGSTEEPAGAVGEQVLVEGNRSTTTASTEDNETVAREQPEL